MALFNLDKKLANAIGAEEQWQLFRLYQNTKLHQDLVGSISKEIEAHPEQEIRSRQLGAKLLGQVDLNSYAGTNSSGMTTESLGGFFGMVLWNHLADSDQDWVFYPDKDQAGNSAGMVYFRSI